MTESLIQKNNQDGDEKKRKAPPSPNRAGKKLKAAQLNRIKIKELENKLKIATDKLQERERNFEEKLALMRDIQGEINRDDWSIVPEELVLGRLIGTISFRCS